MAGISDIINFEDLCECNRFEITNKLLHLNEDTISNLNCAIEKFNLEHANYLKNQLILNTVKEALREPLQDKVNNILVSFDILNDFKLKNKVGETFNFLGINPEDITDCENTLTFDEKEHLSSEVEKKLSTYCSDFMNKQVIFKDVLKNKENCYKSDTFISNRKVDLIISECQNLSLINKYNCLIRANNELLNEIINYKKYFNDRLILDTTDHLLNNAKENQLKARIFQLNLEAIILQINNKTFDALLILKEKLQKKEKESIMELKSAQYKLNDYHKLESDEFKTIVKQYKDIKKSNLHLQWMFNELL